MCCGTENNRYVVLGRITGLFGVNGEVKIHSYTRPREQIFSYEPWYLRQGVKWIERKIRRDHAQTKALVAHLEGTTDRDEARDLVGADIAVHREQLPELVDGEFYQADLIGMKIMDMAGNQLGKLLAIEETGANDVMVAEGERRLLIPLVMGEIIKHIDLDNGIIQVDWNPEYL